MRKIGSTRSTRAAKLMLDQNLLKSFPEGYRHLAYLQTKIGYKVKPDMPGLEGPELDTLYARGARWLNGGIQRMREERMGAKLFATRWPKIILASPLARERAHPECTRSLLSSLLSSRSLASAP